jgi:hypothetical protein
MRDVMAPIFVRLGNRGRDQIRPAPGRLRNVTISGIMAVGATATGSIAGLPGHPVEGITIENVRIATAGGSERPGGLDVPERAARYPRVTMYGVLPAFGLYLRHARDVTLRNVELTAERADVRPALVADDVSGLHVARLVGGPDHRDGPVLWLNDGRGGLVERGVPAEGVSAFLRVTGESTQRITVAGNPHWTSDSVHLAPEVVPTAVTHSTGSLKLTQR